MNHSTLTILGIPGSLRRHSYNRAALKAAKQLVPPGVCFDIVELAGLPMFSEDEEIDPLAQVLDFRERIRSADCLLFATPEYNHSIPGVLKNALDWASRPAGHNAWEGKPAAILGVSVGASGTVRAQAHLRDVLRALDVFALNSPEVLIPNAADRFDKQGHLVHEPSRRLLRQLMDSLLLWTQLLQGRPSETRSTIEETPIP